MKREKSDKIARVLQIYSKFLEGCVINKSEEALNYGVNERSIQRDIDDVRSFLDNASEKNGAIASVVYDRQAKGYRLKTLHRTGLRDSEVFALCKILMDSRAFTKNEMFELMDRLIACCVSENNQKQVMALVRNEKFHYAELRHKTELIDMIWDIGKAVGESGYIEMDCFRTKDKSIVHRKVRPVAVMFSEYYFYVTAFIDDAEVKNRFDTLDDIFPTIYRIDRIKKLTVLEERFYIPYSDRFEEGEFRKRIQFMYGGKLRRVTFRYTGTDIDAVLDRLPTATILDESDGIYIVRAEVFGNGIDMWLRSQGESIEILDK